MYWLQRKHLLASSMLCPKCSSGCRIIPRKGSFSWRCPRKGCQTVVSIRQNSFYSGSHLPLTDCIEMTYYWSRQQPVTMTMIETGHSSHTVVDWYNFHRDVCAQYFIDHHVQIGGAGKIVEIDESKFGRRKYNRGRYQEGHWVFGGVERGTSKAFMVEVLDRSAATLLPHCCH